MDNLLGTPPRELLIHGPSKVLLDTYHWHSPNVGIVASYTPKTSDVHDHFGVFRGVDQIEAFAQATIVSCGAFLEIKKQNCDFKTLNHKFIPAFISTGQVNFHNYLEEGETFISLGKIKFYKFRQMVTDGRIYKAPKGIDLDEYFKNFNETRLLNYDLRDDFVLVAELFDITGRAIKKRNYNN